MPPPAQPDRLRGALVGLGVLAAIWGLLALVGWLVRTPAAPGALDAGALAEAGSARSPADAAAVEGSGDAAAGEGGATRSEDAGATSSAPAADGGGASGALDAAPDAPAISVQAAAAPRAYRVCAGSHARIAAGVVGRGARASIVVACSGVAHVVTLGPDETLRTTATLDEPDAEAGSFEHEARPVVGDVTGDGAGDVVTGCSRLSERGGPRLAGSWLIAGARELGRVGAGAQSLGAVTVTSLALAQLDGRGGLEVVLGHMGNWYANETNEVRLFRGGARVAGSAVIRTDGTESVALAAADLTRDGKRDLLVAHEARGGLTVFVGDGRGGFGDARSFPDVSAYDAWTLDLDGDGHDEVLLESSPFFLQMQGDPTELRPPSPTTLPRERVMTPANLDADPATELVLALGTDTIHGPRWWDIVVADRRADGTFELRELVRSAFHPLDLAIADLDGDRALDLAWVSDLRAPEGDRVLLTIVTRIGERRAFEGPRDVADLPRAPDATTVTLR